MTELNGTESKESPDPMPYRLSIGNFLSVVSHRGPQKALNKVPSSRTL